MTNTIELTDVIETRFNLKLWLLKTTLKLSALASIAGLGYLGSMTAIERFDSYWQQAKDYALSQVTRIEVVREYVEVRPQELPIEKLVERAAAKHNVPPLLMRALIIQESGRGLRTDRVRYEPHLQKRFKRESWHTDMEYQALASSWGLGQIIYGIWKDFCKLDSYADLLDPARNLDCSASIIRDCLQRRRGVASKATRFRQCLKEYNGGGTYAGQVEAHLVELVLSETL
jgi:soluble lytic murein transglycosylase-like protein